MEDLSAASLDDVKEFFATYYAPNNAVLTLAGDFEAESALAAIQRHFGPLSPNAALPTAPDGALPDRLGAEVRETVPDAVELPRVYLAYRIPPYGTDEFLPFELASDLLATGRASRLYARLVEQRWPRHWRTVLAHGAAVRMAHATPGPTDIELRQPSPRKSRISLPMVRPMTNSSASGRSMPRPSSAGWKRSVSARTD
jgi:hypothetical protein